MSFELPKPYRLIGVKQIAAGTCLHLSETGLEDPNTEIVMLWQDETNAMWVNWKDKNHHLNPLKWQVSLEVNSTDAYVIICDDPVWFR